MLSADDICTVIRTLIGESRSFLVIVQGEPRDVGTGFEEVAVDVAGFAEPGEMDAMLTVASGRKVSDGSLSS